MKKIINKYLLYELVNKPLKRLFKSIVLVTPDLSWVLMKETKKEGTVLTVSKTDFFNTSKKFIKYFIVAFSFINISCEQESLIENNLPYEEYVVVRAQLEGDEVFGGVTFTKTLPHTQVYNIKDAELTDVTAYLVVDGIRIIPLSYTKDGIYRPPELFRIESGKYYELFARWNGKQIYAKTLVPAEPDVQQAYVAGSYFTCEVLADNKVALASTWLIAFSENSITAEADDFFEVKTTESEIPLNIQVRTTNLPDQYRQFQYHDRYYVRVYSYDKQYKDYFETKNGNMPIENVFAQGASTIKWNVQGDKTIGLFIGFSKSKMIKVR